VRRRRSALVLAGCAVVGALAVALGPGLVARRVVAPRLQAAFGTTVEIGWAWWKPWSGTWIVDRFRLAAERGHAAVLVRRAEAKIHLFDIVRGDYRLRLLTLRGSRVRLLADASGWRLPVPASTTGGTSRLPPIRVDWAEAPRAVLRLQPQPGLHSVVRARQLELIAASDAAGMRATLWTRGRIDRGSVTLVGRIQRRGDQQRVRMSMSAERLDIARTLRLAPDAAIADVRGLVDVRAKHTERARGSDVQRRTTGELSAQDLTWRAAGVDAVWLRHAAISRFDVDAVERTVALGTITVDTPRVWIRRRGSNVLLPGTSRGSGTGATWTVSTRQVEATTGLVHLLDADSGIQLLEAEVIRADLGAWSASDRPVPFTLAAKLRSGGSVTARATVSPLTREVDGTVEFADVVLPPLLALGTFPVDLESGAASGSLKLTAHAERTKAAGVVTLRDVKTRSPDAARPEDVAAFKETRLELTEATSTPLAVTFGRIDIAWPYLLIDRWQGGIFPYSLARRTGDGDAASPPPEVRIAHLHVSGGRLDIRDATLEPPYWRSLANVTLDAHGVAAPDVRIRRVRATALVDELSPLRVEGTVGAETHLVAEVDRLALPPFNAYLEGAAPYTLSSGAVSGRSEIHLARSELEVNNRIVLSRLGLGGGTDDDFVRREVGIPLSLALALMKDYRGDIELSLPFGGNLQEPTFSMGAVVRQAIVRAIRGAILSPLNALGRVLLRDGRIERFDLDPIPFPPGSASLDAGSSGRIEQVSRVLASRPDLALRIQGLVAAEDVDRLRGELALAALGDGSETRPLREALGARLTGGPSRPLDPADAGRLEEMLAGVPWPADRLTELATRRGAAAAAAFIIDHRLDPERVRAVTAAPARPDALATQPGAAVELRTE
jgi:hypothetical protein